MASANSPDTSIVTGYIHSQATNPVVDVPGNRITREIESAHTSSPANSYLVTIVQYVHTSLLAHKYLAVAGLVFRGEVPEVG